MDSSLASNSPIDCPTTRAESELMWTCLAPAALARSRPASTASYSATLFEALNSNLRACSVTNPSGDSKTTPAPPPVRWRLRQHGEPKGASLLHLEADSLRVVEWCIPRQNQQ